MPIIYVDANPQMIAYTVEFGGSGYTNLGVGYTSMEAEYLAVIYGLNEFFLKWNKELDARKYDYTTDERGEDIHYKVGTPSDHTKRPLPPPICIRSDNEVVVKQLSRQYHISNGRLRKLALQVWKMTENLDVKFEWVPRRNNIAGKMLK